MKKSRLVGALCATIIFLATNSSHAVSVTWTISNNAYLSGTFDYDIATNTYSSFNVSSTALVEWGIDYSQSLIGFVFDESGFTGEYEDSSPSGSSTSLSVIIAEGVNVGETSFEYLYAGMSWAFSAPLDGSSPVQLTGSAQEFHCGADPTCSSPESVNLHPILTRYLHRILTRLTESDYDSGLVLFASFSLPGLVSG